jgi:oligopeptide transport system permease protein
VLVSNLAVDLLYAWLDPRIRVAETSGDRLARAVIRCPPRRRAGRGRTRGRSARARATTRRTRRTRSSRPRAHWLGTDALGRDQVARIAEGARVSLLVAVGATALALAIGLGYVLVAGWVGGRLDGAMMRVVDVVYALPDVLVIVLLIEVLQLTLSGVPDIARRIAALIAAIGFVGWVGVARLCARSSCRRARRPGSSPHARSVCATAASCFGTCSRTSPVRSALRRSDSAAILAESTLSFIGLGIQPPFSSWGTLASDGFEAMRSYPHLIFFPCLAILLALVGFHLLGETLRAVLDPRRRL